MRAYSDSIGHVSDEMAVAFGPADQSISLRTLLPNAKFFQADDILVTRLALDVAQATEGDLVVCPAGIDDPVNFAAQALARGVAAILTEQILPCPLPQAVVADTSEAACAIADRIEAQPSTRLLTIGVIGDSGKTSAALMITHLLRRSGIRTGYETDLGGSDGIVQTVAEQAPTNGVQWIARMAAARDSGCGAMVVDLSNPQSLADTEIGWDLIVITGADAGPSTSMTRSTFGPDPITEVLEQAKSDAVVIVPADHPKLLRRVRRSGLRSLTYGLRRPADLSAKVFDEQAGETTLMVSCGDETALMKTGHCGEAFALNSLAAIAVGRLLETPLTEAVDCVAATPTIPGRMQRLARWGEAAVVIDAAGTPERVAGTLRTLRRQRVPGGKLWCLLTIGPEANPGAEANSGASCTGERLARIGRSVERFADRFVLTSQDNHKSTFLASAHAVLDGFKEVASARLVADSTRAIRWVVEQAGPNDTILVFAGDHCRTPAERRRCAQELEQRVEDARREFADAHEDEPMILRMS